MAPALSLQGKGFTQGRHISVTGRRNFVQTRNRLTMTRLTGTAIVSVAGLIEEQTSSLPSGLVRAELVCSCNKAHSKCLLCACCVGGWAVQRKGTSRSSPRCLTQGARPGHGTKWEATGLCPVEDLIPGTSSPRAGRDRRTHTGTESLSVSESSNRTDVR